MTLCSAALVPMANLDHEGTPIDRMSQPRWLGKVNFRAVYTPNPVPEGYGSAEGDCWMELFPSCPVTIGYPIPSRSPQRPGLEIPVDIMAALIGADRITTFGHDLIIKGYSDLFYATENHGDCIMWHLISNKYDPEAGRVRISFADGRIPQSTDQRLAQLQLDDVLRRRHIIGWTNMVKSNAGQYIPQTGGIPITN